MMPEQKNKPAAVELTLVTREMEIPEWTSRDQLVALLHEKMSPYNDTVEDIQRVVAQYFVPEGLTVALLDIGGPVEVTP